jgi:hypothetical protein
MNPPSMEVIFLILSGVILMAGILYWFWSHLQLTQKKVQLLENAVFELRGMLTNRGDGPAPGPEPSSPPAPAPSAAASVYNDLTDDDWEEEAEVKEVPMVSTPLEEILGSVNPDLQPGGRIEVPSVEEQEKDEREANQFRELFLQQEAPVRVAESLEAMPVKELRRLAEQRGIADAADMRKKELLAALRQQVSVVADRIPDDIPNAE